MRTFADWLEYYNNLGSIFAVSRVRSLILPKERESAANFPEQRLVIEPNNARLLRRAGTESTCSKMRFRCRSRRNIFCEAH